MNTVVFGIGTGRCGTQSLAALLDAQSHASVGHEHFKAQVPWSPEGYDWVLRLLDRWPNDIALYGDVSLYWLPQVERLLLDPSVREAADTIRIVALRRDRDATVKSYMRKTGGNDGRNHWMVHNGTAYTPCHLGWDHCYPKFRASTKREAIKMYWASYYGEVDRLANRYPDQVRCFDLEALNTPEGQRSILRFVGLPDADQVLRVGVQKNTTPSASDPDKTPDRSSSLTTFFRRVLASDSSSST